jgi:hypothetical protein
MAMVNHPRNRGNMRTKEVAGTIWERDFRKKLKKVAIAILRGQMWLHNIKKKPLKT